MRPFITITFIGLVSAMKHSLGGLELPPQKKTIIGSELVNSEACRAAFGFAFTLAKPPSPSASTGS